MMVIAKMKMTIMCVYVCGVCMRVCMDGWVVTRFNGGDDVTV